jgi:lysophospholipase L1-like esterase
VGIILEKNSRLVMIGDSITDCGRARPVGEGLGEALGKGYVALVDAALRSTYPDHRIRVTNMGCSGNTVRDLKQRWNTDVLGLKPDWVSIMIGINDVWRQFDLPLQKECHVYQQEYETTLNELVTLTKPNVKGLILMTPYYIEPNPADAMRARMDEYGSLVKKVARKHAVPCADTQSAFNRILGTYYPAALAWDRVHPSLTGHQVLAGAFMDAIATRGSQSRNTEQ